MTALAVTAVLAVIPATIASPLTLGERRTDCRFATADGHYGYTRAEVAKTIECAARRFNVSRETSLAVAECESHLYPRARNGPYRGVYQIGPVWSSWWRTFRDVRRFLDLRPSVWNARSNVVIALARARGGWSPWACA